MLSIVIPAYNEEKRIGATLDAYYSFFEAKNEEFEIIVVANHCSDQTAEIVRALTAGRPKIRLIDIKEKIGKGGAVKTGIKAAKGDYCGFVDADQSTPAEEFNRIFETARRDERVAIGSRTTAGARMIGQTPTRIFLGRGFNGVVRLLFGLNIRDTQCGAKVFPKSSAERLFRELHSAGWEFDVELLWNCRQHHWDVTEVPITWTEFGNSKIRLIDAIRMLWGLLCIRLQKKPAEENSQI